jgi:polyisoprenoid-binding protein YceI
MDESLVMRWLSRVGMMAAALVVQVGQGHAAVITAVDPAKSEIRFLGKQMGVAAEGRFKKFDVAIQLDTGKLTASRVTVTIDVASIDTGARESDDEVRGRAWFDAGNHPTAKFVLTRVKSVGATDYEANGQLTVKGKTHDVLVAFSVKPNGSASIIEGSFPMKRLQFALGEGPWADTDTVADDVMVRFHFQSATKPASPK